MSATPRFNNDGALLIENTTDIAAAVVVMEQAGAFGQAHLLRALLCGRIAYQPILPSTPAAAFKEWAGATVNRPAVVLVGDDDGLDRGPAGWPLATSAVQWASAVMLHAAGAEIAHYECAIMAAEIGCRTLLVECNTATLPAWVHAVQTAPHRPSVLVIAPPAGSQHPLPLDRGRLQ